MINLNKILPWLSIRNKLLIAFGGLSILPMIFVGTYGTLSNLRTMKNAALEGLTVDVQTTREKTADFLENVSSDLRVIQNSPSMAKWTHENLSARNQNESELDRVSKELLALATTKPIYYQLRLLDDSGDECIRVECTNPNDSIKTYRLVPHSELRHGRSAFYFLMINSTSYTKITLTPAEVEHPPDERIPVMSFAMPLAGDHGLAGIVIANVFEKNFIRVIESKRQFEFSPKVMLVTGEGHYLYHSEKKTDWNRLLASREEDNLQQDYPANIAAAILSGGTGTLAEGAGEIISYAPLFLASDVAGDVEPFSKFSVPVYAVESVPEKAIMGSARSFALLYAGFTAVFLVSAIGLGLLATRQFTRPIAQLESGAEIIAKGNYGHRLRVETNDEIGKLADQFNVMAAALEARGKEILQHRSKLEVMVDQRTRELLEEKTKLQALLDNVPSAFILLDKNFRIQTVSAAFEGLTHTALPDVKGKDCGHLFGESGTCHECLCRKAVESGMAESRIERVIDEKQGERFIERIAIPMKENEEVNSVLQIITDVTKRKRFEQELVYTEKLTAAGEMSSFVAHEFRNSLTSIKMILQLLRESKRINRSEKKSLDVALDSMGHMESVVIELLDFARPKPIKMANGNLNDIVNDSLDFVKSHLKEKRIEVIKKQEDALAPLALDVSQIKESIINILLNAIQSMDVHPGVNRRGIITIVTKRERLRETLRELAFGREAGKEGMGGRHPEIVLGKGSLCTVVEITDTGSGIEHDQLTRIFDPFYTTKVNGTGLGLPMVKRSVNAHGGIVTIESTTGQGTTVRIYFPIPYET
jgi:PAS domain S-box-containing protein